MLYLDYSREEGQWVPNEYGGNEDLEAVEFLKELNEVAVRRASRASISAAEESTAWPGVSRPTYLGGLGFGFKWNMGWMHDTLAYFQQDPVYRRWHHHELTFSLVYAFTENFILPLSHDEVVHGKGSLLNKMPGDRWQKLANLRALYAFMWAHPGKKLLFMGQEFAQEAEWSARALARLAPAREPRARAASSRWCAISTAPTRPSRRCGRWTSTARRSGGSRPTTPTTTCSRSRAARRTPSASSCSSPTCRRCRATGYRLGLPRSGRWREVVNTDSGYYGGSDVGNLGGVEAEAIAWQGQPFSAEVTCRRLVPSGSCRTPADEHRSGRRLHVGAARGQHHHAVGAGDLARAEDLERERLRAGDRPVLDLRPLAASPAGAAATARR